MGNKDITEKRLEDFADVFSDIVNVLLFDGNRLVKPQDLRAALPRSIYKTGTEIHEQERDSAKYWEAEGVVFALIGLENQTDEHPFMPQRVISYDGASYRQQYSDREDVARNNRERKRRNEEPKPLPNMYPTVTLVLYFGQNRWTAPVALSETMTIRKELLPFFQDYRINLFEISFLSDEKVEMFESDFKYVAQVFTRQRKMAEGIPVEPITPYEIDHAKEVLELLSVITNDNRFEQVYNEMMKGGTPDMFTLFDGYEQKGKAEGRAEGKEEGRLEILNTLGITKEEYDKMVEAIKKDPSKKIVLS